MLVGCLTSQQQASVSQGRICSDNLTCCHTEIEVADPTFYLAQSQYTDTGPTSPSADPITPGAWQGQKEGQGIKQAPPRHDLLTPLPSPSPPPPSLQPQRPYLQHVLAEEDALGEVVGEVLVDEQHAHGQHARVHQPGEVHQRHAARGGHQAAPTPTPTPLALLPHPQHGQAPHRAATRRPPSSSSSSSPLPSSSPASSPSPSSRHQQSPHDLRHLAVGDDEGHGEHHDDGDVAGDPGEPVGAVVVGQEAVQHPALQKRHRHRRQSRGQQVHRLARAVPPGRGRPGTFRAVGGARVVVVVVVEGGRWKGESVGEGGGRGRGRRRREAGSDCRRRRKSWTWWWWW